jgi:hypothetical protein
MSKIKDAAKSVLAEVMDVAHTILGLVFVVAVILVAGLLLSTVASAYGWKLPLLPAARPALDLLYLAGATGVLGWLAGFKR